MRPESPQFGSQPGVMPELDFSSPSDVDLINILYIHNIPIVPANIRPELDSRIKSITSWMAWELARIEDAVSAAEDKINLAIAHSILAAFGTRNSSQVVNVLKAVSLGFNGLVQTTQPHLFCVIDYDHNTILETISATIKTFFFNVTVAESHDPLSHPARGSFSHGNNAFAPLEAKFYEARIEYTYSEANFDFPHWGENAPEEETHYSLGKQVLSHRQLRLLKE